MAPYSESQGYREMDINPAMGDPADISKMNEKRRRQAAGERVEKSLDELYHRKSQLEYQIDKASEADIADLQQELDQINTEIANKENPDAKKSQVLN